MPESHRPGKPRRSALRTGARTVNGIEAASSGGGSARRAKLVFSRGSALCKKGLHHVVYTLVSAVDNGLSDSVAAPWIKTQPLAALGPAASRRMEDRRLLSTFMVTNLNDSGAYSLRAGIQSGDATIAFAPGLHGTITLKSALPITGSVTFNGPGADRLSVSGNDTYQVFDISGSASVSIAGLTITEGLANSGGGILLQGSAALSISNCTLTDNEALGITQAPGNTAGGGFGGAIEDDSSGALNVTNSTFAANMAIGVGANDSNVSHRLHPRTGRCHRR